MEYINERLMQSAAEEGKDPRSACILLEAFLFLSVLEHGLHISSECTNLTSYRHLPKCCGETDQTVRTAEGFLIAAIACSGFNFIIRHFYRPEEQRRNECIQGLCISFAIVTNVIFAMNAQLESGVKNRVCLATGIIGDACSIVWIVYHAWKKRHTQPIGCHIYCHIICHVGGLFIFVVLLFKWKDKHEVCLYFRDDSQYYSSGDNIRGWIKSSAPTCFTECQADVGDGYSMYHTSQVLKGYGNITTYGVQDRDNKECISCCLWSSVAN
jgi:hypothetical protein